MLVHQESGVSSGQGVLVHPVTGLPRYSMAKLTGRWTKRPRALQALQALQPLYGVP